MSERYPEIYQEVTNILGADKSGHGMDHVDRVTSMALRFARQEEADSESVELTALLHDVDDYKLVGVEQSRELTNARAILGRHAIREVMSDQVLTNIQNMGYSKYLEGVRPDTLEGAIVSDADMCDAIGAHGILRVLTYSMSEGAPFFDKTIAPRQTELSPDEYRKVSAHAVQHFFDKLLLIPNILMTQAGQREGRRRIGIMTHLLQETFREEGAIDWLEYLDDFERMNQV